MTEAEKANEGTEDNIVDAMFRAQFGTREQSDFIEAHIKKYFVRWPDYKDKLNHLEWYHLFLDFSDKIEPTIKELRDQLSKERATIKSLNQEITNLQITGSLLVDNDGEADLANKLHSVNVALHKELEISENLRKSVSAMRIVLEWLINSEGFQRSFPLKTNEIKSILAKASELDKK